MPPNEREPVRLDPQASAELKERIETILSEAVGTRKQRLWRILVLTAVNLFYGVWAIVILLLFDAGGRADTVAWVLLIVGLLGSAVFVRRVRSKQSL